MLGQTSTYMNMCMYHFISHIESFLFSANSKQAMYAHVKVSFEDIHSYFSSIKRYCYSLTCQSQGRFICKSPAYIYFSLFIHNIVLNQISFQPFPKDHYIISVSLDVSITINNKSQMAYFYLCIYIYTT